MAFSKLEEALFFSLTLVSGLLLMNILMNAFGVTFTILGDFIHILFYILALFVPLYLLVQWIKKTTRIRFFKLILGLLPAIIYLAYVYYMAVILNRTLSGF